MKIIKYINKRGEHVQASVYSGRSCDDVISKVRPHARYIEIRSFEISHAPERPRICVPV